MITGSGSPNSANIAAIKTKTDNLPADTAAEIAKKDVWVQSDFITDTQSPPVQNTWYTAFDETGGFILDNLIITQTNTETDQKTIGLEVTLDDKELTGSFPIDNNSHIYFGHVVAEGSLQAHEDSMSFGERQEFRDNAAADTIDAVVKHQGCSHLKIRYRITSALGTNQVLACFYSVKTLTKV